jgi:hypothetical protein
MDHSTKVLLQLAQWFMRRFLCEFPIGSYVKLSSAVGAILVEGPKRRTRGPLPKLCLAFQNSDQNGHHSRT